ncbi:hypothetical protein HMPREF1624_08334 [Sporothrix schenckii ATCC 58251]|uniref:Uncharacterized protein n=1 Tax=Sporothrix schenckii (strain ATCC 58251 / de Perez 2211183) TaxID=1391915 RepID=U7PKM8_SPOS1|nr:hypothetical protein HMPREF1624_08334 [Sporothrix schenckii ATCC 58251]
MPTETPVTMHAEASGSHLGWPAHRRCSGGPVFRILGDWAWEIWFCFISVASFITIVAVLGSYNNNALPQLPLHISLNTLVALLATLAKAALMIPIAESISQWKWNWFRTHRSLADFHTFDLASRGLWGSVSLIGKTRWRNIATVGAAVTVIGIVTSPITQQTLSYPERQTNTNGTATTWAARHIGDSSGQPYPEFLRMVGAIHSGLAPNGANAYADLSPECSTAECSFPSFATLGICAKVANATSLLNITVLPNAGFNDSSGWGDEATINMRMVAYNVTAPQPGAWITTPVAYTMNLLTLNESFFFRDDSDVRYTTLYDGLLIYSNGPNMSYPNHDVAAVPQFQALELVLHLCVKTLDVRVSEGRPVTTTTSEQCRIVGDLPSVPVFKHDCVTWNITGDVTPFVCGYMPTSPSRPYTITLDGPGGNFSVHSKLLTEVTVDMHLGLTSFWNWNGGGGSAETGANVGMKLIDAVWGSTDGLEAQYARLQQVADGIAIGATNMLRTMQPFKGVANAYLVEGTAWTTETYVHVRWGWLAFLGAQIAICIAFLVFTIAATHISETMVLKSSPLAVLVALGQSGREAVGNLSTEADMKQRAARYRATLVGNELVICP